MRCLLLIIALLFSRIGFSQKILDLHYHSLFGKQKSFQIFNNATLHYKLKGDLLYRSHKLVNMNDSLLVFDNDSVVKLSQLKCIKIPGAKISPYFFGCGIFFILLDVGNSVAFGHPKIIHEQSVLVSSIAIVSGIIIKCIQDKHLYIRKNVTIRILDTGYEDLTRLKP